jgi:hypothetical protein
MSATTHATSALAAATIASVPSLPPRVRKILEAFFAQAAADLSERINQMLVEFEQQLFKQAERARSNEQQSEHFANLHTLRKNRGDLLPLFLAGLEAEVASIRQPRQRPSQTEHERIEYQTMTLVEDAEMDQDIVLREIARRQDARAHTPLYLLGQRFGVLAGTIALDPTQVPVGPQTLCRVLRAAVASLQVDLDSQLLLYKAFDHKVMGEYDRWIEVLNQRLSEQGVLPGLVFAPQRARSEKSAAPDARGGATGGAPAIDTSRPMTGWHGESSPSAWSAIGQDLATARHAGTHGAAASSAATSDAPVDASSFATLQQLLSGRRAAAPAAGVNSGISAPARAGSSASAAPGAPAPGRHAAQSNAAGPAITRLELSTHDVLSTLRALQSAPLPVKSAGQPRRTMMDVQDALLAQVRKEYGPQATLVQEDSDTFELLGLLYNEIEREVKRDTPALELLVRLQVPVAQAALHDRGFFVRPQHPARELLNSVAESGAAWLGEDEIDPQLVQKLQHAVDQVVADYHGDEAVIEKANNEVQGHFRAMARKAEVTERRHVEAARGKDRLEIAKQRASETIDSALQGYAPQKFVKALLNQAWADALTLTLLRNGDNSEEWREHAQLTERIVAATRADSPLPVDAELTPRIQSALVQVGYHGEEAAAIARRLSSADGEDETTSRTELTAKLKARARLGEQTEIKKKKKTAPSRTPKEQECYQYLRALPFGTWFEFIKNQQGDVTRQRLSWFSPVTDNALFVNQRGQRIGEQSLDSLARLMAQEQVRVVTQGKGRLIDRAWQATVSALRNLAGGAPAAAGANA